MKLSLFPLVLNLFLTNALADSYTFKCQIQKASQDTDNEGWISVASASKPLNLTSESTASITLKADIKGIGPITISGDSYLTEMDNDVLATATVMAEIPSLEMELGSTDGALRPVQPNHFGTVAKSSGVIVRKNEKIHVNYGCEVIHNEE